MIFRLTITLSETEVIGAIKALAISKVDLGVPFSLEDVDVTGIHVFSPEVSLRTGDPINDKTIYGGRIPAAAPPPDCEAEPTIRPFTPADEDTPF